MDDFLRKCERSGDDAYAAIRSLLDRLDNPSSRSQARVFLSDLQKRLSSSSTHEHDSLQRYHFRIHDVYLQQYEGPPPASPRIVPVWHANLLYEPQSVSNNFADLNGCVFFIVFLYLRISGEE